MANVANNLTWKAYRDGDRIIIGAAEWQSGALSMTMGIVEFYCDETEWKNASKLLRRAAATPMERVEQLKKVYWTDNRFEAACDAGKFGPAWD